MCCFDLVSVDSATLILYLLFLFYLFYVYSFSFPKTLLDLDKDLISLDLNLLSRIQFPVGLTSHLHTIILHMTRVLASTINLYNNSPSISQVIRSFSQFICSFDFPNLLEVHITDLGIGAIPCRPPPATLILFSPSFVAKLISTYIQTIEAIQ
jgi:hypothetical protein